MRLFFSVRLISLSQAWYARYVSLDKLIGYIRLCRFPQVLSDSAGVVMYYAVLMELFTMSLCVQNSDVTVN